MWYTEKMRGIKHAWKTLKSALSNRGLGINAKKCRYERVVAPTALYGEASRCKKCWEKESKCS